MKRIYTYALLAISYSLFIFTACDKTESFSVQGIVSGADGKTLYFENVGVASVQTIDSAKLTTAGKFKFKHPRPEYPDFYRLRLNNQSINQLINVPIDSTETINITADAGTFATSYTIEGSENCKAVKNITLAQLDANQEIKRLRKLHDKQEIPDTMYKNKVIAAAEAYKEVAKKYIYSAPMSTAAYFALFQQIDGLLFFDLYDPKDSRAYGAVATNYDRFYPESDRTKHLYNLALQSAKIIREQRDKDKNTLKPEEVSYIDIALPDIQGETRKLSSLVNNKVVLINFTAYQGEWSPALNLMLGEMYNKYHDKGLEIYQVSLDTDVHLWKNRVQNLPWTCVRDPQGGYSERAALYNVKELPALFFIDKKGNLIKRVEDPKTIENDIKALL